jgi:hypothetical protein
MREGIQRARQIMPDASPAASQSSRAASGTTSIPPLNIGRSISRTSKSVVSTPSSRLHARPL